MRIKKLCSCTRRQQSTCVHSWWFKVIRGRQCHHLWVDTEIGRHIENKTEARREAEMIAAGIRAGTYIPQAQRQTPQAAAVPSVQTLQPSSDTIHRIVDKGAGMTLDARQLSRQKLLEIASKTVGNGNHVIVRNLGALLPNDIVAIASAGRGAVTFDFTDAQPSKAIRATRRR